MTGLAPALLMQQEAAQRLDEGSQPCGTAACASYPTQEPPTRRHERLQWAELLRRTYAIDVLVGEDCGARREMIAFLTAPDSIRRILEHLGPPTRPPPIRRSLAALFELN
jgi:hypothetical protein